jgi:hypothetical protein
VIGFLAALLAVAKPAPACTAATAVAARLEEIAAAPDQWFDRCVRLDGYAEGGAFYSGVEGFYRRGAGDAADRPNEGWVGLYLAGDKGWRRPLRRATVVGRVDACGRIYERSTAAAEPGSIIMLLGYCHYEGGLVLMEAGAETIGPARLVRAMGDEARIGFGDLEPAGPERPLPGDVAALVNRYLVAFQAADREALGKLVTPYDALEPENDAGRRKLESLLLGEKGPFAPLKARPMLEPVYFQARVERELAEEGEEGDWFACLCKTADCTRVWPIAAVDATAREGRPYVCLRVFRAVDGSGSLEIGLEQAWLGLPEPAGPS